MSRRVGILTIHNSPNYGACLQSFALYEYLRQEGYDVEVIDLHRPYHSDYVPSKRFKPDSYRFETPYRKARRIIRELLRGKSKPAENVMSGEKIRDEKRIGEIFSIFNDRIRISRPYAGIDALYDNPPAYDTYVTGSDQVWNPTQSYCIEPYFLTFVKRGEGRKISYASSIGISTLTPKEKRDYSHWLKAYDAVSVRESSAQALIKEISGLDVKQVADPTFLLGQDYWCDMAVSPKEKDYILVFTLDFEPEIMKYAQFLARESGKRLVSLNLRQPDSNEYTVVRDASPEEWLGYVRNADLVLTDSFHCTVFSILLSTSNFYTYIAPWNDRGSRIRDLLASLGLSDHLLDPRLNEDFTTLTSRMIDHAKVDKMISTQREDAREFLKDNI